MGSEGNNMNDATSYQPSEPVLCANGCGFFGTAATNNLCSKCYNSFRLQEEQQAAAKVALDKLVNPVPFSPASLVKASPSSSSAAAESAEQVEKQDDVSSSAAAAAAPAVKMSNRCLTCKKKVGVMGFSCKCGCTFCGVHRYPEKHGCTFDFKGQGREAIAKANPIVKGDKIQRF